MSSRARRLKLLTAAVVVAAAVLAGAIALGSHETAAPATARQTTSLFAGIPQSGTTLGDPRARVTLTEFADLQCPFCAQFAVSRLPVIVRDYVRAGKARIVYGNLAFLGPDSVKAARFAAAAGQQGRLFDFIDRFYANQGEENSGYVTDEFLHAVAAEVPGLDAAKAFAAAGSPAVTQELQRAAAAANTAGVRGTPTFVLKGRAYDASTIERALRAATA